MIISTVAKKLFDVIREKQSEFSLIESKVNIAIFQTKWYTIWNYKNTLTQNGNFMFNFIDNGIWSF